MVRAVMITVAVPVPVTIPIPIPISVPIPAMMASVMVVVIIIIAIVVAVMAAVVISRMVSIVIGAVVGAVARESRTQGSEIAAERGRDERGGEQTRECCAGEQERTPRSVCIGIFHHRVILSFDTGRMPA